MKRRIALLLVLCLFLSGCGQRTVTPPPVDLPTRTDIAEKVEELPSAEETPEAAVPPPVEEIPTPQPPITEPVPEQEEPLPPSCTISICCKKALEYQALDEGIKQLLPQSGWILAETEVLLSEGESVFDILLRVTRQQNIAMEFVDTVMYGSAYVEGIGHLYEFDCGGQSGWIYTVNGQSPNVGCSNYAVQDGDVILWEYVVERT